MTLLEEALRLPHSKIKKYNNPEFVKQQVDLVFAYLQDEVTHGQITELLKIHKGGTITQLGRYLVKGVKLGLVKIEKTY